MDKDTKKALSMILLNQNQIMQALMNVKEIGEFKRKCLDAQTDLTFNVVQDIQK